MYIYTTSLSLIHIFIYIYSTSLCWWVLQLFPHLAYCICCGNEHRVHFIFSKLYFHILFHILLLRSRRTGSYGNSNNILRNCHIVFHSGCTNLLSHEQYMILSFLHSLQHISFSFWLHLTVCRTSLTRDQTFTPCSGSRVLSIYFSANTMLFWLLAF